MEWRSVMAGQTKRRRLGPTRVGGPRSVNTFCPARGDGAITLVRDGQEYKIINKN